MIDIMNNKQVSEHIFGCQAKLRALGDRMSKFHEDHHNACKIRELLNKYNHNQSDNITDKQASIVITNELVEETYSLQTQLLKLSVKLRAMRPGCMCVASCVGSGTVLTWNRYLTNFQGFLTDEQWVDFLCSNLDGLVSSMLYLHRADYTFDVDSDIGFFTSTFQSNRKKTNVELTLEVK